MTWVPAVAAGAVAGACAQDAASADARDEHAGVRGGSGLPGALRAPPHEGARPHRCQPATLSMISAYCPAVSAACIPAIVLEDICFVIWSHLSPKTMLFLTERGALRCGAEEHTPVPLLVTKKWRRSSGSPAEGAKHYFWPAGLRIQRMPSEPDAEFGNPANYPYMCVASPSCHDTSTTRAWYEEDSDRRQRFYNDVRPLMRQLACTRSRLHP